MSTFMGEDDETGSDSVGGPLYPPIRALWFYLLALLPPQTAYRLLQFVIVLEAFAAGLGLRILSQGRFWYPLATLAVIIFPGFAGSLCLGQNSVFSLNILMWGWVLISRDRPVLGGLLWGLLAFKPVWAAAFFLVPLWTGRWRVALAMLASGLGQTILTLPLVGWQSWEDWLTITREAMRVSQVDENWILRSRDLFTLPRRWLDFDSAALSLRAQTATLIGWALWLVVVGLTTGIAVLRKRQSSPVAGAGSAFLLLAAILSCIHFMYYDVLLAVLPVFLLYAGSKFPPWRFHILVAVLFLAPIIPGLKLGEPPTETWCLLGLWALSGWSWIAGKSALTLAH
jgi:arabinofuranan 3-O-arabinosyltransferase